MYGCKKSVKYFLNGLQLQLFQSLEISLELLGLIYKIRQDIGYKQCRRVYLRHCLLCRLGYLLPPDELFAK